MLIQPPALVNFPGQQLSSTSLVNQKVRVPQRTFYAFQTWPARVLIVFMALRVSTMQCAQSASCW